MKKARVMEKPKESFRPKKDEKITYRNVSYRIDEAVLLKFDAFVGDQMSASKLVEQIMQWAIEGQKK